MGLISEEFNLVKKFKAFKPPPLFLPRDAGEDEGGGLNGLNGLNVLNQHCRIEVCSSLKGPVGLTAESEL
jgi:hypothetical protein